MSIPRALPRIRPVLKIAALIGMLSVLLLPISPAAAQSAPATPSSVTVTRTGSTLSASWDAPAGASKYHVTYSSDNKNSWSAAAGPGDNHSAASIEITGINTSKAYIVAVRAGNQHGWSGWRDSAPNPPIAPPERVNYVSISRNNGSITASWNSVSGASKYHITYSSDNRQSWSLASANHASTSITFSVQNQHTYHVGVRAGSENGWSGWRNSPSSAPWIPSGPPSAPGSVNLSRTCEQFSVSWTPVLGATGYDVNTSKNNRKSWQRALSNVTHTTWIFAVWKKHKPYHVSVRARNASGVSGWTNSAVAHPPSCEVSNLRAVTGTTHGQEGGSITATWNAAQNPTGHNVNYRASGGQWQRTASNVSGSTHTGSVSSTVYDTVAVQSIHGNATSGWRNAGIAWLTAGDVTASGATLNLAGHSGNWYVKKTSPTPAGTCSAAGNGSTHALADLSANSTYTFAAYGDSGCNGAVASATFTTSVPASLTVSAITKTGATLTIANHTGNWYLKQTAPTAGTCSASAITGTTHTLSTLSAGSPYGFTAYSDAACATEIATAGFTTLASISSLGSSRSGHSDIDNQFNQAAAFSTGSANSGGYVLKSVTIPMRNTSGSGGLTVTLQRTNRSGTQTYSHFNDQPSGTVLATLSGTAPTSGSYSNTTWTCSGSGCELDSSTVYFIVASRTGSANYSWNYAHGSVATVARSPSGNGWNMGYKHDYLQGIWSSTATEFNVAELVFEYSASLDSSALTAAGATLTISNYHDGYWYYKATSGPHATCQGSVSGTSVTLSGLTSGASYTYTAYSDSGCATEVASTAFSTQGLTASNVTATGATLTVTGHAGDWYYKYTVPATPADTCSSVVAAGTDTATLTTLTPGTTYTFNAYSDSGCTTVIGGATFKTKASLGASAITSTGATLTITGHTGQWWYKADAGPDSTCKGPVNGATKDLTGLTPGTTYAYTAYSDNTCATAITPDASITPVASLSASNVTSTGGTLTISGHAGDWYYKYTVPTTPAGTCSSVVAAGTDSATLSTLTPGTDYTFKAYSDSNCATELATATLTTPELAASAITTTTATLTFTGPTNWWLKRTSPADSNCKAKTSSTESLSTLTAGASYTYKAYGDSTCATELASATFTTAVSAQNFTNVNAGFNTVGKENSQDWAAAQAFTTGSNTNGYTLSSVTAAFGNVPGESAGDIVVKLHSLSGHNPGSELATLTGGNPPSAGGNVSYSCSGAGCALAASTTYMVVISAPNASGTSRYGWKKTTSTSETLTPTGNGWSIADGGRVGIPSSNYWTSGGTPHQIQVTAIPN